MARYRIGSEEAEASAERESITDRTASSVGRTYCLMAIPSADRRVPLPPKAEARPIEITEAAEYIPRRRREKSFSVPARVTAGLLLTALMIAMPLWLTADGMLPVMKRLSTAAVSVQLSDSDAVSVTELTTAPTESTTTATTAAETTTAASTTTAAPASTEGMLPVEEKQLSGSGTKAGDIYIKNSTGYKPDFEALLKKNADCRIKLNANYQVLIVHTHTTESYACRSDGVYDPDYSPRSTDTERNMVAVGEVLAKKLEEKGIRTLHATEVHDHPQYNGSYDRALDTIEKYLSQYPSIEMVLDVHRDAITYDSGTKLKPTAVINGKKAAQVMIISGCDANGKLYFPEWESNLTMALDIQQKAHELHPGLMRPLNFAPYRYNMHMTPNSLLLEFGTDVNTIDEALYSAELMGDTLAQVLLEYDVERDR
ncbi:MAG: stage II sporulation protein P [Ruminococcaceae bacterium]|nr:stage II sporulation protein P [Oscillospiraceae bacterium]